MVAVRWTGFLASSFGKLWNVVSNSRESLQRAFFLPLDLSAIAGSPLARKVGQRTVAGSCVYRQSGSLDVLGLVGSDAAIGAGVALQQI